MYHDDYKEKSIAIKAYGRFLNNKYSAKEEKMELLKTAFKYHGACYYNDKYLWALIIKNNKISLDEKMELLNYDQENINAWICALRHLCKAKNKENNEQNPYWKIIFYDLLNRPYKLSRSFREENEIEYAAYGLFKLCRDDYLTEKQKKLVYDKHRDYLLTIVPRSQFCTAFRYVMNEGDRKDLFDFLYGLHYLHDEDFKVIENFVKTLDKNSQSYNEIYDSIFDLYDIAIAKRVMNKLARCNDVSLFR